MRPNRYSQIVLDATAEEREIYDGVRLSFLAQKFIFCHSLITEKRVREVDRMKSVGLPPVAALRIVPATAKLLSHYHSADVEKVRMYSDRCAPTTSKSAMIAYPQRLDVLARFKIEKTKLRRGDPAESTIIPAAQKALRRVAMSGFVDWLEVHEKLSGWTQAVGALLALIVAIAAVHMQASYALRHEDRRTAERVRSLARTFEYWKELCLRTYKLRERHMEGDALAGLGENFEEFNFTASEINKFAFVDAPCTGVFDVICEYRRLCAPLSGFMSPGSPATITEPEMKEFARLISKIGELAARLFDDAKRIGRT